MLSHPPCALPLLLLLLLLLRPRSPSLPSSRHHSTCQRACSCCCCVCFSSQHLSRIALTNAPSITSEPDSTRPHHRHPCTADRINPPSIHQSTLRLSLHPRLALRPPPPPPLLADSHTTPSIVYYREEEDTRRLAGGYAIATSLQSWVRALHSLCGAATRISLMCLLLAEAARSAGDSHPLATCSAVRSSSQRTAKMAVVS